MSLNRNSVITNKSKGLQSDSKRPFNQDNLARLITNNRNSVQWTDEKKTLASRVVTNGQNSLETGSPKPIIKKREPSDTFSSNYPPLEHKYRGAMNRGQLESERKRFTAELRKMQRIDEGFIEFMINEFDKITDL